MLHHSRSAASAPTLSIIGALAMALGLVAALALTGSVHAATVTLTADLTSEAEVHDAKPDDATGTAVITADDETGEVCYELTIDGLEEEDFVVAAHIHVGEAGVAGEVVVPLFTEEPEGDMNGCVTVDDLDLIAAILANPAGYYVNIHSDDFPEGAVRGQLEIAGAPTGECTLLVSVGDGEPAESVTVQMSASSGSPGVALASVNVFGSFIGDAEVEFTFIHDGEMSFTDTMTADAEGNVEFLFGFEAGDEGTWVFEAVVPETECAATAEVTVQAAAAEPTASPTPTPAPVVPDTAVDASRQPVSGWAAVLALVALLGLGSVGLLSRQRR